MTFLKFHAQRKSLYQLIKLQPRKLVGSKNDTIRTYRLTQHGCSEHSCIVPLPTQMDDAESSPGGGCVTSARKMIIGTSDTKGTRLRTKARSRIMLRPPTCLRKRINTFPQERTETKTLHKECRYWDLDIDFERNIFQILLVWSASMLWRATLRYKHYDPSHK